MIKLGGSLAGFNARMAYYPDDELAIAVLANTNTPKAEAVQQTLARGALGLERLVPTDLPLNAEERARYTGTYDTGQIQLRVYEEGERLLLQPSGQSSARLLFQGHDVFLADVGRAARVSFRLEDGRATSLTLSQGSQPLDALRIQD